MSQEAKLDVKLIGYTKDAEQIVASAIRQCYSESGAKDLKKKISAEKRKKLIEMVVKSGHTSTIEHAVFTFAVQGISRACSHQLVRHRIASYSQQSQRYVDFNKKQSYQYIIPPAIKNNKELKKLFISNMNRQFEMYKQLCEKNIKPEDARFVLPNASETKIVITMNARSLYNFFKERTCLRAQWEIRVLAENMLTLCKKTCPNLFNYAGPSCVSELICRQGERSCGKWKQVEGAKLI